MKGKSTTCIFLILGFFTGCLISCTSTRLYKEKETLFNRNIPLALDSTIIELRDSRVSYIFSSVTIGGRDFVAFLAKDTITIYDMTTGLKYKKISVPVITSVDSSGYKINSISLSDTNEVYTLSTNLITRYFGDSVSYTILNTRPEGYLIYNLQNDHPLFNKAEQAIFAEQYTTKFSQNNKAYYMHPLYAKINIQTGTVTNLPLYFSKLYTKNYYGFANLPYFSAADNLIVSSFPADPNIYIFDKTTNKINIAGGRSAFQKSKIEPLSEKAKDSKEEKMKYWYQTPEYNETLLSKDKQYIFRFFKAGQALKNELGKYNTYNNKQMYLMVFKNNALLMEIPLNYKTHNNFLSFTGNKSVYIVYKKEGTENMVFKKYKILE